MKQLKQPQTAWFANRNSACSIGLSVLALSLQLSAAAAEDSFEAGAASPVSLSLRQEIQHAVGKGLTWLEKSQDTNGFWSTADHPAVTALALSAFQGLPDGGDQKLARPAVAKGYAYLLGCVQSDGGIYRKELASYNTSIAMMALLRGNRPEWQPIVLKARKFLIGLQCGPGEPGQEIQNSEGGIGYGTNNKRPDLSNTAFALEALYYSKRLLGDKSLSEASDLNWAAAIRFVQNCQNLPGTNVQPWVADDPQDKGGFVYSPGNSMAGKTNLPSGRVALRSYGSMSYAGLLSYIYADLKRDDPRVTAVMNWLRDNFTLDENPAMGPEGLFYYYHTLAKALTLCGTDTLQTKDGRSINWREQLALKLINLQRADGSWANANGRWWEKDPNLVTSYALIALETIGRAP